IQQLAEFDSLQAKIDYIPALDTEDKWLNRAQKSLAHGCPLSCELVERQLGNSKEMTLAQCFKM
ncbi:enoyl-CoA hydratase, partial [Pseudoalteromonas sp. S4491]